MDFPEHQEVSKAFARQGRRLPQVDVETAALLNEAYAEQQPLESLLARHRHFALAGAPLRERLAVLRRLSEVDAGNPVWLEDVSGYEAERFKQIRNEAELALRERDYEAGAALLDELKRSRWQQIPPDSLVRTLEKSLSNLQKQVAREELESLEGELNLAHGAMEVERGRELRERWNSAAAICSLAADDPLSHRAGPALEWLAEEDRRADAKQAYAESVARLERSLEIPLATKLRRDQLETEYHAVMRHDFGIDATLESQYRSRIEAWELSASRRTRLLAVLGTVSICVAAAGIVWVVRQQDHNKQVAEIQRSLESYLSVVRENADKLPEALGYVETQRSSHPFMDADPKTAGLIAQISAEAQKESERKTLFEQSLELALKNGPQALDRPSFNRAKELARKDSEKAAVMVFESEVDRARHLAQKEIDDAYGRAVEKVMLELGRIEKLGFGDVDGLDRELARIKADMMAVQAEFPAVSAALTSRLAPISTRVNAMQIAADRIRAENNSLKSIREGVNNLSSLPELLLRFATQHPNNARSEDFQKTAALAAGWEVMKDWNTAVSAAFAESDSSKAAVLSQSVAEKYPAFPKATVLRERAKLLGPLAQRLESNGLPKTHKLRDILESPLLQRAFVQRIRDDKTGDALNYYLAGDDKVTIGTATNKIDYVADFGGTQKNMLVPPEKILGKPSEAPHCELVRRLAPVLDRMKKAEISWEEGFAELIRQTMESQAEPLLRLNLVKQYVTIGCQGSEPLRKALELELRLLETPQADLYANWLDPKDELAKQASATAKRELGALSDVVRRATSAVADAKTTADKIGEETRYEYVGCLLKAAGGAWQLEFGRTSLADIEGVLHGLQFDPAATTGNADSIKSSATPVPIGNVAGAVVKLNSDSLTTMREGSPVWVERVFKRPVSLK